MSKKKLQVEGITNELEGASLFFNQPTKVFNPPPTPEPESEPETPLPEPVLKTEIQIPLSTGKKVSNENNGQVSNNASKHASMHASTITYKHDHIEAIRKTVKQVGKAEFFMRVTTGEKHTLGSIVYAFNEIYRGEGRKTSENEVGRIALNFLLEDYLENGNYSILARVLAALNA